jgi:Kef-type K+ transport system membrane component KefB
MPVALGFACVLVMRPDMALNSTMFIAATLAATSIGVTAHVLKEMGRNQSREGHIILGAAVCDDILGLIILAVVSGFVVSGSIDMAELIIIILLTCVFLIAAFMLGPTIVRWMARVTNRLDIVEAKMFTSYLFVMVLAWMANLAGLATIIGAFAAAVVLHDGFFKEHRDADKDHAISIRQLIEPLEVILVPIFFILMGIQVKIESFLSWPVLTLAGGLLLAAIVGKLFSGIGSRPPSDKWVIGIGMLPRGEVGLVFAAIGRTLGVIDDSIFAAIVLMVFVTTVATPPLLKIAIGRHAQSQAAD